MKIRDIAKIHFVGIGGIGMSALARMMVREGKEVTSTNDIPSPQTLDALRDMGVPVYLDRDVSKIPEDVDVIVYSLAWDQNEKEFMDEVRKLGKPVLTYFEMLGVASQDKYTVAVAGTHGKTTTTAMIAKILLDAAQNPTVIVGSLLKHNGSTTNFIHGESNLFVVEACEYKRSFLHLNPNLLVITNIEADHLDYYKDLEDVQSAFKELAEKVPDDGYVVCDTEDDRVRPILENVKARVIDYNDIEDKMMLRVPGRHNEANARAAVSAAQLLSVNRPAAITSVEGFEGTWRRAEYKGELPSGAELYDDYAHHPTEIKATLAGFRAKFPEKKLVVIFQPHLYSRTKSLLNEFAESFSDADEVIVLPIYAAREQEDPEISSEMLVEKINHVSLNSNDRSKIAIFRETFEEVAEYIKDHVSGDSVVLTMGAGDVWKINDLLQPS